MKKPKVKKAVKLKPKATLTPKQKWGKVHTDFCQKMLEIANKKNSDYTGVQKDPFHNLKASELLGIAPAEKGIVIRMLDKINRVNSFLDKGVLAVKDESIEDTLLDIANYASLMNGIIKERKEKAKSEQE